MSRLILSVLLVLIHFAIQAQDKKPITHEAMWALKRVASPEVSPDGKWVIFGVTEASYDDKEQSTDIWITATDGSTKPRKLTAARAGESAYTWSPDGKYISFVAKRDGDEEAQIYLMNFKEGGEGQRFTNLSTGASAPRWSPDGSMILFNSNVYPKCYTDSANKKAIEAKKKIKYKARVYTAFPVRLWDHWLDERQTHAFVQSLEPESKAVDIFTQVSISQLEGFRYTGATWSPDGKEIIFSATTDANTAAYQYTSSNLYKVSLHGGDASRLTNDKNDYSNPVFSSDGKYLLSYVSPTNIYKIYTLDKLVRFDWPSMQNRNVISASLDRPIGNFIERDNIVYLNVEDQGRDKIYTLSINGGEAKVLNKDIPGCLTNLRLSEGANSILVSNYESATMPAEIVKINSDGSTVELTSFNNQALSQLDLQPVETIWFTSSRGKKIRSLIVKPAGFNQANKYPLLVLMHGGPAGSWKENWSYRWNYHLLAKPGYVLILTDYTGSTGYGEKFSQDIQFDPFKGPGQEINEAATDAIKRFLFIDGSKQAAAGGSYGGHLANWMQATTTHYKCLINHAGLMNSISQWGTSDGIYGREVMNGGAPWSKSKTWKEQSPSTYAEKFKTPMLVTVGELDYRVPVNNSLETWHILQRQKIPSKLIVFPDENHWILKGENSRFFYKEVHDWLGQYLK